MSKNIIVISSSPRRNGNSDLLCDRFIEGALESGNQAEKVFLKDYHIGYCIGCGACYENVKPCVLKDDMAGLLEKMKEADVIVMATPVYFYTMCAQMKTFIDRCNAGYTKLSNKEFYFIAAAAEDDKSVMERTIDGFRGFLDCLENPAEKGVLLCPGVWEIGEVRNTDALNEAYNLGKSI